METFGGFSVWRNSVKVRIGLEALAERPASSRAWGSCAVLVNQASLDSSFRPSQIVLRNVLRKRLKVLFSPQHGLFADKQDNMIESGHGTDLLTGLPVYSLYSEVREPTDKMLEGVDTVLIDIQDVGTRVYTFVYTMAGIMRRCAALGKRVVVLDRPNPIGGQRVEGNVLEDDSRSFVGEYPLPMRHGMTIGELARWMKAIDRMDVELEVIRMRGWKRSMHWKDTGRTWIMTSPNIPTAETAEFYPGMVLLEGTNMSEGRGTTLPFLIIGAPYLKNVQAFLETLQKVSDLGGAAVRPLVFEPTFQKWERQSCWGIQWIPTRPDRIQSYQLGLGTLVAAMHVAPEAFSFNDPPYEYETVRPPIQLLLGSSTLADALRSIAARPVLGALRALEDEWKGRLREFLRQRNEVLLYR